MGVVYKLTQEIIDFIIKQKRENPSTSCRGLVNIVYQNFGVKVSKSSINILLKSVNLSSPVGRRSTGDKKPKKFKIPKERKQRLFNVEQKGQDKEAKIKAKKPQVKGTTKDRKRMSSLTSSRLGAIAVGGDLISKKLTAQQDALHDGIGSIFLKAAEWEISSEPILGKVLREHVKGGALIDLDTASEILVFMQAFGIQSIENLPQYTNTGLWALSDTKDKVDSASMLHIVQGIDDIKVLMLDFSIETEQLFKDMRGVKISLESGEEVNIDARLIGVWSDNVQSGIISSFNKTMSLVGKHFVRNVQTAIFYSTNPMEKQVLSKGFLSLAMAFENIPGKRMASITLFDENGDKVATLNNIPNKRRHFIAGIWPWQPGFTSCLALERIKKEDAVYIESTDQEINFQEINLNAFRQEEGLSLRGFLLRESLSPEVFVVLVTNITPQEVSSKAIVSSYLERWPNKQSTFLGNKDFRGSYSSPLAQGKEEDLFEIHANITDISRGLLLKLDRYVKKHYFAGLCGKMDLTSMISAFYSLPGSISTNKNLLNIRIYAPSGQYPYYELLDFAIKRINESEIFDFKGRKLIMGT